MIYFQLPPNAKQSQIIFICLWGLIICFYSYFPAYSNFFCLSVSIVCESWIFFRLPGSRFLWMYEKNSYYTIYRKIRMMSAVFLWILMLAVSTNYSLLFYWLFMCLFESIVVYTLRIPPTKGAQRITEPKEFPNIRFAPLLQGIVGMLSVLAFVLGFIFLKAKGS